MNTHLFASYADVEAQGLNVIGSYLSPYFTLSLGTVSPEHRGSAL